MISHKTTFEEIFLNNVVAYAFTYTMVSAQFLIDLEIHLSTTSHSIVVFILKVEGMHCSTVEPLHNYSGHPCGKKFGRVAFIEVLFCTQTDHLGPGFLAVIQRWPLFRGGR